MRRIALLFLLPVLALCAPVATPASASASAGPCLPGQRAVADALTDNVL
jgi:hypothetical protein